MDMVRCLGYKNGFKTKNWKKKSVGLWITDENKKLFEELSSRKMTKGERRKVRQERIKAEKEAYISCNGGLVSSRV